MAQAERLERKLIEIGWKSSFEGGCKMKRKTKSEIPQPKGAKADPSGRPCRRRKERKTSMHQEIFSFFSAA
jgi:hypothetical protein